MKTYELTEDEEELLIDYRKSMNEKALIRERQLKCTHSNYRYTCAYANKDWYECNDCHFSWSERKAK